MNRREALIRVAGLMGGTLSAAALLALDKVYAAPNSLAANNGPTAGSGPTTQPGVLSASQQAIVSAVADIIIPRTNTPGALDVGAPKFIDVMLRDVYPQADLDRYLAGLAELDTAATTQHAHKFVALEQTQQVTLVRKFHDAALANERQQHTAHTRHPERPFILMTKELTLLSFFTSQVGATQVLQYVAVPGSWHGCLPLKQAGNGKTWAVEPGIAF
jgi:glucoside 3-dehydrogenase (cytochrome c) hitch-hiker subunit